MKRSLLGLLLLASVAVGCNKAADKYCGPARVPAATSEVATLRDYITSKGITASFDSMGFYYQITTAGPGVHPTICNTVKVNYKGWLTNGTQFDGANGKTFALDNLINGWRDGLPLVGKGGTIILYLPPSLGYGSIAQTNIPANSITTFEIDLLDVY
jgi:FKBP-type peptidyl-prolyl cis-trans isomerase FkpA